MRGEIMKALLLYVTGTFNTKFLAEEIKRRLLRNGYEAIDLFEVKGDSKPISLDKYDLIGLGYPIYAFNSPRMFNKYLNKLTYNRKAKYFIFKQSGESFKYNNASSRTIKHILKKNKCELINEHHYLLPYNIHFRFEDSLVKQVLEYDDVLLDNFIYELNHHINTVIKSNFFYNMNSVIYSIQRLGGPINGPLYKVDEKKCTKCNLCISICPKKNIERKPNGKMVFHNKCEMCMRCSFLCPHDAISIGFLKGWKVNGAYNLNAIKNDDSIKGDYIKGGEKGFFSCYKKTFDEANRIHQEYYNTIE